MKTYILDTCVLIHDPKAYLEYPESEVIIPVQVLTELDKLKSGNTDAAKNARICIRNLDELSSKGELFAGIKLENGAIIRSDICDHDNNFGPAEYMDNKILATARFYSNITDATLISRDINLRVRARAHNINAESYEKDRGNKSDIYTGIRELNNIELGHHVNEYFIADAKEFSVINSLYPNECVVLHDEEERGVLARKVGNTLKKVFGKKPWGLESRNKEQAFATELLMDTNLPFVSLIGTAGTGKTLVTIASALEMVIDKKKYDKLVIYRPIVAVGNDIGYLPGSMEEKLAPWMSAIYDSFEFLLAGKNNKWKTYLDMLCEKGFVELNALTYIRGRSIPNAFIVVDEVQNLTKEEVKTILTRVGPGTKIVFTGDINQIDSKNLDAVNNGLSYVVEKFKESELSGHITFEKGVRSELATLAAELL